MQWHSMKRQISLHSTAFTNVEGGGEEEAEQGRMKEDEEEVK